MRPSHTSAELRALDGAVEGGADLDWDVLGAIGYKFNDTISAEAGYRAQGVNYSNDGFTYDMIQHGADPRRDYSVLVWLWEGMTHASRLIDSWRRARAASATAQSADLAKRLAKPIASRAYILTAEAESDLRSVIRYTRAQWSASQVRRYVSTLERGIANLVEAKVHSRI